MLAEMEYDLDFRKPRVTAVENCVIIEGVKEIVMLAANAVSVRNTQRYVTVTGSDFVLKEISEGRLVVEGQIQGIEFLRA